MVKSRYIGDGHPTFNRNPYNGYINLYYWVDDPPLLISGLQLCLTYLLIRQFSEALLLFLPLGMAIFEGSVSFVWGLENKALDNSLSVLPATLLFSQRGVNSSLPFNPFFEANHQFGQSFERLRSCEISMDVHLPTLPLHKNSHLDSDTGCRDLKPCSSRQSGGQS